METSLAESQTDSYIPTKWPQWGGCVGVEVGLCFNHEKAQLGSI